jgi:hypothetical protein
MPAATSGWNRFLPFKGPAENEIRCRERTQGRAFRQYGRNRGRGGLTRPGVYDSPHPFSPFEVPPGRIFTGLEPGNIQAGELQMGKLPGKGFQSQFPAHFMEAVPPSSLVPGGIPAPVPVFIENEVPSQSILVVGGPGPGLGDDISRTGPAPVVKVLLPLGGTKPLKKAEGNVFLGQPFHEVPYLVQKNRMEMV